MSKAAVEWQKASTKLVGIRLNINQDKEVLDYLKKPERQHRKFGGLYGQRLPVPDGAPLRIATIHKMAVANPLPIYDIKNVSRNSKLNFAKHF